MAKQQKKTELLILKHSSSRFGYRMMNDDGAESTRPGSDCKPQMQAAEWIVSKCMAAWRYIGTALAWSCAGWPLFVWAGGGAAMHAQGGL